MLISIVQLFALLILVGVVLWAVQRIVPMNPQISNLIQVLAVVFCVFVLVYFLVSIISGGGLVTLHPLMR